MRSEGTAGGGQAPHSTNIHRSDGTERLEEAEAMAAIKDSSRFAEMLAVAENPQSSAGDLDRLVHSLLTLRFHIDRTIVDRTQQLAVALANNPSTPKETLAEYAGAWPGHVVKHPQYPEWLWKLAAETETFSARGAAADSPHVANHEDVLAQLAGDWDPWVRIRLVSNPHTPPHILEQMAADNEDTVVEHVAANPNTPAALERLALRLESAVRRNIVNNPSSPAAAVIVAHMWGTREAGLLADEESELRRSWGEEELRLAADLCRSGWDGTMSELYNVTTHGPRRSPAQPKRDGGLAERGGEPPRRVTATP